MESLLLAAKARRPSSTTTSGDGADRFRGGRAGASTLMSHVSDLIATDIDAYLEAHQRKSLLRFITCGSVDDGKSTLIGRLLYNSKMIFEDQLAALEAHSGGSGCRSRWGIGATPAASGGARSAPAETSRAPSVKEFDFTLSDVKLHCGALQKGIL